MSRPNRVLDGDGHIIERDDELFEYLEAPYAGNTTLLGYPFFPALDGYNRGAILARLGVHKSYEITPQHWVDTLDKSGMESTVLYPTAGLAFAIIQDPEWARALARAYNDWFTDRYYNFNKRLRGMALIPLQDVKEAVKELRRAVLELGMVGAVLPANGAEIGVRKGLGHPDFWPIYEEAEKLNVPVATHGAPSMSLGINHFQYFAATIALEHPIAQMIQVTSFIMEGVFDRFPKLRVGFLEAGTGWVPYMMDRLDRSYEVFNRNGKREFSPAVKTKPSDIFASGRLYFSCEGGEPSLKNLVDRIGHKTLLFASDYPHEANLEHAMHEIEELFEREDLPEAAKSGIFCDNVEAFYAR